MILRRSAALLVLASLALTGEARAEGALVTLVRPRSAGALVRDATARLSAELGAAGFSVHVVEGGGGADARAEMERMEGSLAAFALVGVGRGAAADVWIADRITGKTVARRVDVADPAATTAASDLAVRSVELLRASLLEIHERPRRDPPEESARVAGPPPPPPAGTGRISSVPVPVPDLAAISVTGTGSSHNPASPPPPAPAPASAPPRLRPSVEIAAAILASTEGSASPRPLLRVAVDLPRRLSLRLAASPSAVPFTLSAPQGTVEVRQWLAGLDLAYAFTPAEARLRPVVALGGGVYGLHVDGSAIQGYVGEHNDGIAGFVAAGAGLGVRLTEGLTVLADVEALALVPALRVTAVGVPLAHLGRPAFLPALGLVTSF